MLFHLYFVVGTVGKYEDMDYFNSCFYECYPLNSPVRSSTASFHSNTICTQESLYNRYIVLSFNLNNKNHT